MMHIAFATVTCSREGFFAEKENEAREEQIVGMLQGAFKQFAKDRERYSFADLAKQIDEMLVVFNQEAVHLESSAYREVFRVYEQWRVQWENLKTGESLTLEV